jgi:hypothetical protein
MFARGFRLGRCPDPTFPRRTSMKKTLARLTLSAALLVCGASVAVAKWLPVHQIGSEKPLAVTDGDTRKGYSPSLGFASSNWQVGTTQAFSHAIALTPGGLYEFRLVHVQSTDDGAIKGLWDIYRDGLLACDDCVGRAYGLDGALGSYFKIYVGTPDAYAEKWHFSGYITSRFDY